MAALVGVSAHPVDATQMMEPSHPVPRAPLLKRPYGQVGQLITARNALLLTPAALGGMAVVCPDVLARLLLQVLCFFGSLIEPFDSLLPQTDPLRALVTTVKQAYRADTIKHGIPSLDDQQFFEDEDEDEDGAAAASSAASDDNDDDDEGDGTDDGDDDGGDGGEQWRRTRTSATRAHNSQHTRPRPSTPARNMRVRTCGRATQSESRNGKSVLYFHNFCAAPGAPAAAPCRCGSRPSKIDPTQGIRHPAPPALSVGPFSPWRGGSVV